MVNGILEVVPQLRRRCRARHALTEIQLLIELLAQPGRDVAVLRRGNGKGVVEFAASPGSIPALAAPASVGRQFVPVDLHRLPVGQTTRAAGDAKATGVCGWSERGEEFRLDGGAVYEEGVGAGNPGGDGRAREQG